MLSNAGSHLFEGFRSDALSGRVEGFIDSLDGGLTGGVASESEDF